MAEDNTRTDPVQGVEGRMLERGKYKGKGIAVFTSGGDSQVSKAKISSVE